MNPVECEPVLFPKDVKRKVLCQQYSACLDLAIDAGWASFSCDACQDYSPPRWEPAEAREDGAKCLALALSIGSKKRPHSGTMIQGCLSRMTHDGLEAALLA